MNNYFSKVRGYLQELDFVLTHENEQDQVFVIENEEMGISNMIVGCADPLVIIEQFMFEIVHESAETYKLLLKKNRDIIHGAFVLDDTGKKVIFRDTLQLENLDLNELEASLNSFTLLVSEYSEELIKLSKN